MMNKHLIKELEEKFEETRKELGLKSSLEEMDKIFFIKDFILREKFVSDRFSRQLCSRILETYNSWISYLHNFVFPNPGNMVSIMENKMLDENEKKKVSEIFKKTLNLTSKNPLIGLTKDKKEEGKFIDEAVNFWNNYFEQEMIKIMKKISKSWESEAHGI